MGLVTSNETLSIFHSKKWNGLAPYWRRQRRRLIMMKVEFLLYESKQCIGWTKLKNFKHISSRIHLRKLKGELEIIQLLKLNNSIFIITSNMLHEHARNIIFYSLFHCFQWWRVNYNCTSTRWLCSSEGIPYYWIQLTLKFQYLVLLSNLLNLTRRTCIDPIYCMHHSVERF